MHIIVGLGNPGNRYDATRHNAGFVVVDALLDRHPPINGPVAKSRFHAATIETSVKGHKTLLVKPTTFMNLSGQSVQEALAFYKLDPASSLLVVVDDLALPCGAIRVRASGSAAGHNGLADIQRRLGTQAYPRLRVGIDPVPPFFDQADYVLGKFTAEQKPLFDKSVSIACDAIECWLDEGLTTTMNRFNAKADKAS